MKTSHITCPYNDLPNTSYWSRSVAIEPSEVDPVVGKTFLINKDTKISTAGSCFAQHIARYLSQSGYNYYVPEYPSSFFEKSISQKYGYGLFSGRFGNIYTVRQLLQLLKRAYGSFEPGEDYWISENGRYIDPFRPNVVPAGFISLEELYADRKSHLRGFRNIIEKSDVFVFTLGLTESWQSKEDGAVFPVCPGCGAGEFDADKYEFINFTVSETVSDLKEFIELCKEINPNLKFIFTVSPVPLIATKEQSHVLSSTTYSKSVLRVAAQEIVDHYDNALYFPSYEIITSSFSRGSYFGKDLRSVKEEGVKHVMRIFFKHFTGESTKINKPLDVENDNNKKVQNLVDVVCEEELLTQGVAQ